MKAKILGCLAVGLLVGPMAANAAMLGSTLEVTGRYPNLATTAASGNVVVGAGIEVPLGGLGGYSAHAIDLSDTQISFTSGVTATFSVQTFNGFVISDLLNNLAAIDSVTVDNTLYPGFLPGDVTWDADNIYVNFSGVAAVTGDKLLLNVTFVPEPGVLALFGLGLAGLGLARRRKAA